MAWEDPENQDRKPWPGVLINSSGYEVNKHQTHESCLQASSHPSHLISSLSPQVAFLHSLVGAQKVPETPLIPPRISRPRAPNRANPRGCFVKYHSTDRVSDDSDFFSRSSIQTCGVDRLRTSWQSLMKSSINHIVPMTIEGITGTTRKGSLLKFGEIRFRGCPSRALNAVLARHR